MGIACVCAFCEMWACMLAPPAVTSPYTLSESQNACHRLKVLVENGPHPPPGETGARYIIRDDGHRLDLRYLRKESDRHLEFGYKVSGCMLQLTPASTLLVSQSAPVPAMQGFSIATSSLDIFDATLDMYCGEGGSRWSDARFDRHQDASRASRSSSLE